MKSPIAMIFLSFSGHFDRSAQERIDVDLRGEEQRGRVSGVQKIIETPVKVLEFCTIYLPNAQWLKK